MKRKKHKVKKKQKSRQEIRAQKKEAKQIMTWILERIDFKITLYVLGLVVFGIIMIYSTSSYSCSIDSKCNYDAMYFARKQLKYVGVGIIAWLACKYGNYHLLEKTAFLLYLAGIACIFALKSPLGVEVNHATRWLKIGVQFQVAEVVKITLIIWLAAFLNKAFQYSYRIRVLAFIWISGAIPTVLLLVISNDLSSALVVAGITFGISFLYTDFIKTHVVIMALAVVGTITGKNWYAKRLPTQEELDHMAFRYGRIAAWIDPERYADKQGYQTLQALYAIGSGGLTGKGLGRGVQKLSKIPESQNDMIFSIICEELGIIGALLLILLFICLVYQLVRVGISCKDMFGSVLVMGIALQIALQVVINISVCLNVIPNTGIPMPFISYGGTSLVLLMGEMGMVLSVFRWMQLRRTEQHMKDARIENRLREQGKHTGAKRKIN